jgi:DNA-binding NtrC family response regulator
MNPRTETTTLPTGREVLVVEDEQRIRNMLGEALKHMGFRGTAVASAEAATRAMAQKSYDILILDLNLPGMDGMEFLETVRRQRDDLQVIILTGYGDLKSAQKAIRLDVAEFLTKPCALGDLERALDRASKRLRSKIVGYDASSDELKPRMEFETAPPAAPVSPPVASENSGQPLSMQELEQRHILEVLHKNGGNRAATAKELGISLRKLYYRLGEYQRKGVPLP